MWVNGTQDPDQVERDLQTSGQSMCSNGRLAIETSMKNLKSCLASALCLTFLQFFFRAAGIYLQILIRIVLQDISRFTIIFSIIWITFAGSFYLVLVGTPLTVDGGATGTSLDANKIAEYVVIDLFCLEEIHSHFVLLTLFPDFLLKDALKIDICSGFFFLSARMRTSCWRVCGSWCRQSQSWTILTKDTSRSISNLKD